MKPSMSKIAEWLQRTTNQNVTAAVIVAAGNSTRMGGNTNKQFLELHGVPVLAHTLLSYQHCKLISKIVVVTKPENFEAVYQMAKEYSITKLSALAAGGASRQESAKNGIAKLDEDVRYVAIADGARCLTTPKQIAKVCLKAYRYKAASAAHLISDTVKRTNSSGMVKETVDRTNLWQAQTPQIFHTALYQAALYKADEDNYSVTDDNSLIEHLGYQVKMVVCGIENIKITTPDDLPLAEAILQYRSTKI